MGQFYSREFDGDPYIDLMRAIPERELVWWVQKVIWLAEGFTFADHFARTYPRFFQHKCKQCHGAGTLTCPQCSGLKKQPQLSPVAGMTLGRSPAALADSDCRVCGHACSWDEESEWEGKWGDWESKLAYYDRTYGPLMDEWYEDMLNAGNLEEDTQQPEEEAPGPERQGRYWDEKRHLAKDKKRLLALAKRFGHPYEADRMLGYQIVDPTVSMGENVWNLTQVYNVLPPELNPLHAPKLLQGGRGSERLSQFLGEVDMEAAVMQNLQAAIQDKPKPHRFGAAAGTVECPSCKGAAWSYSFFPNVDAILRTEQPFWMSTLQQMNRAWYPTPGDASSTGHVLPYGEHGLRSMLQAQHRPTPLEALGGEPAPASAVRYRKELELLAGNPELRSSMMQLRSSAARLPREMWDRPDGAAAASKDSVGRSLDDATERLAAPAAPEAQPGPQRQQWAGSLLGRA